MNTMLSSHSGTNTLKNTVFRVADWTVPPRFQRLLIHSIVKVRGELRLEKEIRRKVRENEKYRDIHKGERCFILCTGSSINRQDILPLKDELCIAASLFSLHKDYAAIAPRYHVLSPFHPPHGEDDLIKEFSVFKKHECDDTVFFLGHLKYIHSYYNFLNRHPEYRPRKHHFIYYGASSPIDEYNYRNPSLWDISRRPFAVRSVLYVAIQVAVYLGCKDIYLLGVDHDHLLTRENVHFYDRAKGVESATDYHDTETFLSGFHYRWKQYRLMRTYLEEKGVAIYNASPGSLLDVFPSVNLVEIIGEGTEKSVIAKKNGA